MPSISHLFFVDDSFIFVCAIMYECSQLKICLDVYEKASEQLVNFQKSTLSFSPKTRTFLREEVKELFGVPIVLAHEVYLWLPTFTMRNKRVQFGYIRDKVMRKLQGWKENFCSLGSKEVLIKLVIHSYICYVMLCIPSTIIHEIESDCARF